MAIGSTSGGQHSAFWKTCSRTALEREAAKRLYLTLQYCHLCVPATGPGFGNLLDAAVRAAGIPLHRAACHPISSPKSSAEIRARWVSEPDTHKRWFFTIARCLVCNFWTPDRSKVRSHFRPAHARDWARLNHAFAKDSRCS